MMLTYTILSDFLLYIAVSLIAGYITLKFVSEDRKPAIRMPKKLMLFLAAALPFLGAAPVVELVFLLSEGEGLAGAMVLVLTQFRTGQSYLVGAAAAFCLLLTIWKNGSPYASAASLMLFIVTVSFAGHAASIQLWSGFVGHTIHFAALAVWAGVAFIISFFVQRTENYRAFLQWFTPLAFFLVALVFVSGFVILFLIVKPSDYAASYMLPYGQMLLLKHLSIIPLLAAAAVNGFFNKKSRSYIKLESAALAAVFLFTAVLSKMTPPHNIDQLFRTEGTARFVEILSGTVTAPVRPAVSFSLDGMLLLIAAALCILLLVLGSRKPFPLWLTILLGATFICAGYLGIMMNMKFD